MSKKISKQVDLNADELVLHLEHIIENNRFLQERRQPAIALEVQGGSGLGKTSIIEQIAVKHEMNYVKLNLAQIGEEVSELVGYPIRQFEVKNGSVMWIDEQALESYRSTGYEITGKNRMGYCPPEWIAGLDPNKPTIFNLDDWTRGSMRTIQAVMEIISRQEYISWKLPKGSTVVLTANPSDGEYLVNETDQAQKSRYTSVNLKFDKDCWMRYAEEIGVDTRCINFLGLHPEMVTKDCNPRSITTFFNSIASIKNFSDEKSLALIQMLGEGSVGQEFSTMFVLFINNKLDRLITPDRMVKGKEWSEVKKEMTECIGSGKAYRADIASVLGTRIVNYSQVIAKDSTPSKEVIERLIKLTTEDLLQDDIKYQMVKQLINGEKKEVFRNGMMKDEKVQRMALK